jgi:hypothetical protein
MDRQPMPPMLESLIKQMHDRAQSLQFRENVANRLEDVVNALNKEVSAFRGNRRLGAPNRSRD